MSEVKVLPPSPSDSGSAELVDVEAHATAQRSYLAEFLKLVRFLGVGVFNTVCGYGLFVFFAMVPKFSFNVSNTLSYLIMISVAFFFYKKLVFQTTAAVSRKMVISYFLSAAVAFALNIAVLNVLLALGLSGFIAQIGAMVTYSAVFFLANRLIVFR